jgi:tetratricopeptide (TPR) repeat protein
MGDARLLPGAGEGARYAVALDVQRSGDGIVTRATITERPRGATVTVGEVRDGFGLGPSTPAVWHVSSLVKLAARRRDADLAVAKPPGQRDARDLYLMAQEASDDRQGVTHAIGWLEAADKLSPGRPHVLETLGFELDYRVENGWSGSPDVDLARAMAIAHRLLRDTPDDVLVNELLIDNFALQGRWADARVAADRLLVLKHEDPLALMWKGKALLAQGEVAAADDMANRMLPFQNHSTELDAAQLVGLLRFAQGRHAEAAEALRHALQLTPQEDLGRPQKAWMLVYLAAAEAGRGNGSAAREALTSFHAAAPSVHESADFWRLSDAAHLPLVERARVDATLASLGWRGSARAR